MPPKVSRETKNKAISMGLDNKKQEDIAMELGVSCKTIQRAKKKLVKHGDIEGGRRTRGPKPALDFHMMNVYPQ
jgi:transposase